MNDAATGPHGQINAAPANGDGGFPATRWSMVFKARRDDPAAANALAELCRMYWRPVYSFLRRQGNAPEDAEDLTQGFFAMLLDQEAFATVDKAKGKLRSFLLAVLKRFAANEYKHARTQKRGGRCIHVPIDAEEAEERYTAELFTGLAPDVLFERQWTLTLLNSVLAKLREESARDGREGLFDALKDRFSADGDPEALATVARQFGMSEGSLKVTVHRMRQRYRTILRNQIALTVDSPREVDEEMMHLFKVFGEAR